MPRRFVFPDPQNRSVNEPTVIMSSAQILGLYNQENPGSGKAAYVTDAVRNWTTSTAQQAGWSEVTFSGNQALLTAKVSIA